MLRGLHTGGENYHELVILANTPGVPIEWVCAVFNLKKVERAKLLREIKNIDPMIGAANAANADELDGWKMLEMIPRGYSGAIPLWSQMALKADRRSAAALAKMFGVGEGKLWKWRNKAIFCPLTGLRLVPPRGCWS